MAKGLLEFIKKKKKLCGLLLKRAKTERMKKNKKNLNKLFNILIL